MAEPINVVGLWMWNCRKLKYFDDLKRHEFFWKPLLTMKCSRLSCTHSCEWKRRSPSFGSSDSSGWISVVDMVALGSASMICLPLYFSASVSKSEYASKILSRPTMIVLSDIHQYCSRGFFGTHTTFRYPYFISICPYFPTTWIGFQDFGHPFSILWVVN